ncbi:hypothetical protein BaRGS_00006357 [Batillaria attramentaria]|uniref:Uncharacterized protein n=1 Tax=Batillaria attramentaria TaxID=370345 RepID=A0ABD0LTR9_9CAEN
MVDTPPSGTAALVPLPPPPPPPQPPPGGAVSVSGQDVSQACGPRLLLALDELWRVIGLRPEDARSGSKTRDEILEITEKYSASKLLKRIVNDEPLSYKDVKGYKSSINGILCGSVAALHGMSKLITIGKQH